MSIDNVVIEAVNDVHGNYASPLGMTLRERPNEQCKECCFRQRWQWALILSVLGIVMLVVGMLMSKSTLKEERDVATIMIIVGLFSAILPLLFVWLMTYLKHMRDRRPALVPTGTNTPSRNMEEEIGIEEFSTADGEEKTDDFEQVIEEIPI